MANELEIWSLEGGGDVTQVVQVERTESELELEDALFKNPDMLMPGLKLIGRQTPTSGGPLDLLGLDGDGKLVVFELKRGSLTREAVTQIIDYVSSLESMNDDELVEHIEDQSQGKSGIEPIEKFRDWYEERYERELSLRPVQMTLVGLGVDARATCIVEFLAKQGMPISMLTFHGYHHDGKVFLAKQVQTERAVAERVRSQSNRDDRERKERFEKDLDERIAKSGIDDFWGEVLEAFPGRPHVVKNGFNFSNGHMKLPDHGKGFNIALSIRLIEEGRIRIIFSPASIHLCRQEFDDSQIDFNEESTRAPLTNDIKKQRFLDLDYAKWQNHKEDLIKLADAVDKAWREAWHKWRKSKVSS